MVYSPRTTRTTKKSKVGAGGKSPTSSKKKQDAQKKLKASKVTQAERVAALEDEVQTAKSTMASMSTQLGQIVEWLKPAEKGGNTKKKVTEEEPEVITIQTNKVKKKSAKSTGQQLSPVKEAEKTHGSSGKESPRHRRTSRRPRSRSRRHHSRPRSRGRRARRSESISDSADTSGSSDTDHSTHRGRAHTKSAHSAPQRGEADYVDHFLRQEDFQCRHSEGKTAMFTSMRKGKMITKPYMFSDRDGCSSLKQKFDIRGQLGALEYIECSIKLALDKEACRPEDKDDILRHLINVVRDHQSKKWPEVRQWTHALWDAIERKDLTWGDRQARQNHRFENYLSAKRDQGGVGSVANAQGDASAQGVVCRDYNSERGCRFGKPHSHNGTNFLHLCNLCWKKGYRKNHTYMSCEYRQREQQEVPRPPQNNNNNNQWTYGSAQQSAFPPAKNGHQAPNQPQGR